MPPKFCKRGKAVTAQSSPVIAICHFWPLVSWSVWPPAVFVSHYLGWTMENVVFVQEHVNTSNLSLQCNPAPLY